MRLPWGINCSVDVLATTYLFSGSLAPGIVAPKIICKASRRDFSSWARRFEATRLIAGAFSGRVEISVDCTAGPICTRWPGRTGLGGAPAKDAVRRVGVAIFST